MILACEAHQSARMLRYADPGLVHLLEQIPYASSATVTLAYRRDAIAHPLDGFGFVVPRIERRPIIACTFSSVKYPGRAPDGHVLLRTFLGGALDEAALEGDDEALTRTACDQVAEVLGAREAPLFARVSRYRRAMPQYLVGHLRRVDAIESGVARQPGLGPGRRRLPRRGHRRLRSLRGGRGRPPPRRLRSRRRRLRSRRRWSSLSDRLDTNGLWRRAQPMSVR